MTAFSDAIKQEIKKSKKTLLYLADPFSVVVLGNFRRFFLVFFYFFSCISIFPLFTANFQCPFGAFFIEKIFLIYYNNSTL